MMSPVLSNYRFKTTGAFFFKVTIKNGLKN